MFDSKSTPVRVYGERITSRRLAQFANTYQKRYRFQEELDADGPAEPGCIVMHLLAHQDDALVRVSRETGVSISTLQAQEISRYLDSDLESYLMCAAALGLAQHRVLDQNELIVPEDFMHAPGDDCIFSAPRHFADYALKFEDSVICSSCSNFYGCLGAESELIVARRLMDRLGKGYCLTPPPD